MKTRHPYTIEPITYGSRAIDAFVHAAESLESNGAWIQAGETYVEIANRNDGKTADLQVIAKTYARAGVCFEFANQHRLAANAYEAASHVFSKKTIFSAISAELEGYASTNFRLAQDPLRAGHALMRAAHYFSQLSPQVLTLPYAVGGIPMSAGHYTTSATCYEKASELFVLANELGWSRFACWQAGVMHANQGTGYHAYLWYRRALVVCIRTSYTLDPERLRAELPMSATERNDKINPLLLLEPQVQDANRKHQALNPGTIPQRWIARETARQMRDAYREFAVELSQAGNPVEAAGYATKFRAIQRQLFWWDRRFGKSIVYFLWAVTCGYGQSLGRWMTCSCVVIISYAIIYWCFGLLQSAQAAVDYLYFSVVTITTLGYGDILPSGAIGKMVAASEAIVGFIMFGFLLTLLNRSLAQD